MTDSEPGVLMAAGDSEVLGSDTEGCRLVIASYEAAAPQVSEATADAARRIMGAPALGDFMELRFVDMGPWRGPSGDRSAAARLILEGLLAPGDESGLNYFAVAVADHSAAEVELVLSECVGAPFLNTLPVRMHGIASVDDRTSPSEVVSGGSIAIAASGGWNYDDLVDELRRHAHELLVHFAAGRQGLSHRKLDSLRDSYKQHVRQGHREESADEPGTGGPAERPAGPVRPALPDIPVPEPPQPATRTAAAPAEANTGEANTAEESTAETSTAETSTDAQSSAPDLPTPAAAPSVAPPPARLLRRLPGPPWRREKQKQPEPGLGTPTEARAPCLAYLLITGGEIADDLASWQRSRAVLLRLDAQIAAIPRAAYQVRVLQGDEERLHGDLRAAGQCTKKDLRSPVTDTDFAAVLDEMRALLRRDVSRATASGEDPARCAVVIFAADPPLADSVTAAAFSSLAQQASIIWVLPRSAVALLPDCFTEPPHVHVLSEHDDVTDEIAALLSPPDTTPVTADDSAIDDDSAIADTAVIGAEDA